MKRVLIVTDAWRPQVNGLITVFSNIIPELEAKGIEVRVIEPGQFKTIPLPMYPEIRLSLFPKKGILRHIDAFKPDAVHIATEGPLGMATRSICIKRAIPFTTSFHTMFQLYLGVYMGKLFTAPTYAFLRRFHSKAVRTMVATPGLQHELEKYKFKNVVLWPFGVDTNLFVRSATPPIELPHPVFVYLGRLAKEKSVEDFLSLELPGSKLLIGDGPERPQLEKKYPDAHFVGYKFGKDLPEYLSSGDVCVFPSRTETFGLVVVEALACGLPVAAYDVMGPRDILTPGKDGYMGEDLKDSALKCLELSQEDCRLKALEYSWTNSAEKFFSALAPITASE